MMVPRKLTVLIDTREKRPILFPETIKWYEARSSRGKLIVLEKKEHRMEAGDYALEGFVPHCLIERKGSLREVHQNLFTRDHRRAQTAFDRLCEATYNPYLLLDMSPADMWRETDEVTNPEKVFDALMNCVQERGLRLIYAGNCEHPRARRILGEQMVRLMMAHAFRGSPQPLSDDALKRLIGD